MVIVDSSGWLEWFADGKLADAYQKYLADQDNLSVPTITLYEVYKILKREVGEEKALLATGYKKTAPVFCSAMRRCRCYPVWMKLFNCQNDSPLAIVTSVLFLNFSYEIEYYSMTEIFSNRSAFLFPGSAPATL